MSRVFAYCRVSTVDQTTDNQLLEIQQAGFAIEPQRVISEVVSGSVAAQERKGFRELLVKLESGDVLIVTKLDRLGRSALDVRQTVDLLQSRNIRVHCLALGGVDLTSPAGKMTMQILSAVAEFERDLIVERTQAGLERAKAEGRRLGRPNALTPAQEEQALVLLGKGESVAAVARQFDTTRQSIMRLRNRNLNKMGAVAQILNRARLPFPQINL
ncbi:recombinase family protein, partial [Chromobacterium violaceum]